MGKAILSHTQKQEAVRRMSLLGKKEVLSKVKGVCVCERQSEMMHVAWGSDKGLADAQQGYCRRAIHLRPSTAPEGRRGVGASARTAVRLLAQSAVVAQQRTDC